MTIQYTCTGCGAVMKIKDDKAGTKARCPKCREAFVVPSLDEAWDGELEFEKPAASEDDEVLEPAKPAEQAGPARKKVRKETAAEAAADSHRSGASDDDEPEEDDFDDEEDDDDDDIDDEEADDDEEDDIDDEEEYDEQEEDEEDSPVAGPGDDGDDPDMPLELTPAAPVSDAFDPSDVLGTSAGGGRGAAAAAAAERKASVADMMRDFEAAKRREKKSSESIPRPIASSGETAGSAAEAISRAYQQKRENIMNPKIPPKEGNEQMELFVEWLKRTVPLVLLALVLSYLLYSFVNRRVYTGPPLAPVSGVLTRNGAPAAGYQVRLVPVLSDAELQSANNEKSAPGRSTASGLTDGEGKFVMMYTIQDEGASIGEHHLEVIGPSGIGLPVPKQYVDQTVPPEGIESLKIDLP